MNARITQVAGGGESCTYGYDWCGNGKGLLCYIESPGNVRSHFGYNPQGWITVRRDMIAGSDDWTHYDRSCGASSKRLINCSSEFGLR